MFSARVSDASSATAAAAAGLSSRDAAAAAAAFDRVPGLLLKARARTHTEREGARFTRTLSRLLPSPPFDRLFTSASSFRILYPSEFLPVTSLSIPTPAGGCADPGPRGARRGGGAGLGRPRERQAARRRAVPRVGPRLRGHGRGRARGAEVRAGAQGWAAGGAAGVPGGLEFESLLSPLASRPPACAPQPPPPCLLASRYVSSPSQEERKSAKEGGAESSQGAADRSQQWLRRISAYFADPDRALEAANKLAQAKDGHLFRKLEQLARAEAGTGASEAAELRAEALRRLVRGWFVLVVPSSGFSLFVAWAWAFGSRGGCDADASVLMRLKAFSARALCPCKPARRATAPIQRSPSSHPPATHSQPHPRRAGRPEARRR